MTVKVIFLYLMFPLIKLTDIQMKCKTTTMFLFSNFIYQIAMHDKQTLFNLFEKGSWLSILRPHCESEKQHDCHKC